MKRAFIMDGGPEPHIIKNMDTGEEKRLERYAVWTPNNPKGRYEVEEVSDDLAYLQKKYGPGVQVIDAPRVKK